MGSTIPKVMQTLRGKPLVEYVVQAAEGSALGGKPVVVVGARNTAVQDYLRERAEYAVQTEQLGTGHAVATTENQLTGKADQLVVLYGDMPFITSDSIIRLVAEHRQQNNTVTFMTINVPDFSGGRQYFYDFSRVVRDAAGKIVKDVQRKDASPAELKIRELNTCYFCFRANWLWDNLRMLQNNNAQREYYLTDLINLAIHAGERVGTLAVPELEAVGVNTPEHLEWAQSLSDIPAQ